MSAPYFRVIQGQFVIVGKEPDGDSVRFIANNPDLYRALHRSYRIKPSRADGSVQLRFEGIDAPELHYGSAAQPLGATARDQLLARMGFANIEFKPDSTMVRSAEPASVPGAILSQAAEANGRPVSYVLLGADAAALKDGHWVYVSSALLDKTMNAFMLTIGMAYYTVYTSTPFEHRRHLRALAAAAREQQIGVWAQDQTDEFMLENDASIGPEGQLILPKLFRRATDYLKDVARGFSGNLSDWIVSVSQGSRDENDRVLIDDYIEVQLSELLEQRNRWVAFQADPLDIVFVEK